MKNNYPPNSIDSCIKTFFKKLYTPKVIVRNVPKRNIFVKLLSLGNTLFQKSFTDKLASFNLKIVFVSPVRVQSFLTFKNKSF